MIDRCADDVIDDVSDHVIDLAVICFDASSDALVHDGTGRLCFLEGARSQGKRIQCRWSYKVMELEMYVGRYHAHSSKGAVV